MKGQLLTQSGRDSVNGAIVQVRSGDDPIFGVAVVDAIVGEKIPVAQEGYVDVLASTSSSLVGLAVFGGTTGNYDKATNALAGKHSLGITVSPMGAGSYPSGWVRIELRLSQAEHTHNDIYYTETEIDAKLTAYAIKKTPWLGDRALHSDSLDRLVESVTTDDELSYLSGTHAESHLMAGTARSMGWMDTSTGKNGETFDGHSCLYMEVINNEGAAAVAIGDLVIWDAAVASRPGGIDTLIRPDNTRHPCGVVLEVAAAGVAYKMCVFGAVDIKCSVNSTGLGVKYQGGAAGNFNEAEAGAGNLQIGNSMTVAHFGGYPNWVRVWFNPDWR